MACAAGLACGLAWGEGGGFSVPGAYLVVETRPPAEVLSALEAVAEAVKPGAGRELRASLAGDLGLEEEGALLRLAGSRPAALALLDPQRHPGQFVFVVGDGGAGALVDLLAKRLEVDATEEEEGGFVFELGDEALHLRRVAPPAGEEARGGWLVGGMDESAVKDACEALRGGRPPRAPSRGAHLAARLDMRRLLAAHGEAIKSWMLFAKGAVAAAPLEAQLGEGAAPVVRMLQEMLGLFDAMLSGLDAVEVGETFAAPVSEIVWRFRPSRTGRFREFVERQTPARWTAGRILPRCGVMTLAGRFEPAACEGLVEPVARALARIVAGEDRAEEAAKYAELLRSALSVGEVASSLSQKNGVLRTCYATSLDLASYRKLFQEGMSILDAFMPFYKAMGIEMRFEYSPESRRLADGRPVDRVRTSIATTGPQAEALEAALAIWGGRSQLAEIVATDWGTVGVAGAEPAKALEEILARDARGASFAGRGWPEASSSMREALARAPERTFLAGEFRLGAYMAFAFEMMRKADPAMAAMMPQTELLEKNDPPLVWWAASEGGELVTCLRVPLASIGNLVEFFERAAAGPDAGGDDDDEVPPLPGAREMEVW